MDHTAVAQRQRAWFRTGASREIPFRLEQLSRLREAIVEREAAVLDALKQDLGRPAAEGYMGEAGIVLQEIDVARRHLAAWARPRRVRTPLALFPGTSRVLAEPYGSVLIIAPWNYPFQLAIAPLIAALAAGNCAVLRPSPAAPQTSRLVADMIRAAFRPEHVCVVEGGIPETQALLAQRFDYVFFTGAAHVGRLVMAAAAKHLTPVTLELGGKNPCIVDRDADLAVAARRIAWGKFLNAGQTCIAPDFVLAHASIAAELVERLGGAIAQFYGADPLASSDYGRIVDEAHYDRLEAFLRDGSVAAGGRTERAQRYIAPTVLARVSWDSAIMREEIFGPILPVLEFEDLDAAIGKLQAMPNPLALYVFSRDRARQDEVLRRLPSGGACINDTFGQFINLRLPFGGVGESGMGAYHGKAGFDTFSHMRGVVRRATWADPGARYPPYRLPLALVRRLMSYLL